jgi:hypothetical protein
VVLIHQVNQYSQWADEEFRWFSLPFPQAYLGLEKWEASFTQAVKQKKVGFLAQFTLPIISHAYLRTTLADRQIAALQCIEAIRLYAADHAGQLPRRLQDITEVPVPENPATGKPFGYTVNGNTAVLEAVSPEPTQEHLERYELILDSSKPAAASTDAKGDAQ